MSTTPIVVEIEPGDRPVGRRLRRLLVDVDGRPAPSNSTTPYRCGSVTVIGEDRGASLAVAAACVSSSLQAVAVEDVVAEDQRDAVRADEIAADDEGMRRARPARPGST